MFCPEDCIIAATYSFAKLFIALTNKERWNITDLNREKWWRAVHCGNIGRWLEQKTSYWWDTWMHKTVCSDHRTEELHPLLWPSWLRRETIWMDWTMGLKSAGKSKGKKLMFYMHESIWNWRIYLSSETTQAGCLTATRPKTVLGAEYLSFHYQTFSQ